MAGEGKRWNGLLTVLVTLSLTALAGAFGLSAYNTRKIQDQALKVATTDARLMPVEANIAEIMGDVKDIKNILTDIRIRLGGSASE